MTQTDATLSTGLPGLDRVLKGLIPGDNIVWQVDAVEDFVALAEPYCRHALASGRRLIYFRYARHRPLAEAAGGAEVHELDPEPGFEQFITEIHRVIMDVGRSGHYLFDCLSDLPVDWCSDRMLGNFFMLTCPLLYDLGAVAYFTMLRNHHSFHATRPITNTSQVLGDIYRHRGRLYVHPLKVQRRHSPTMYMLHVREGDEFIPVTQSITITRVLADVPWSRLDSAGHQLGYWSGTFARAEAVQAALDRGERPAEDVAAFTHRLRRMAVARDGRILDLAARHLDLSDMLDIRHRMIGTGLLGGKTAGMLLARAILTKTDPRWKEVLEPHDSFFIGADVFYTYLVENGLWWAKQKQKDPQAYLDGAERARQRMLHGTFPDYIIQQFADMLDYFGQSPIIVRSSSLLEDNYLSSFAGKYESVFCVNQDQRHRRLEDFLTAVRRVYASTMSAEALTYRARRGMLGSDEQMSLLVQRVSGAAYGDVFHPQVAGVGLSFNPYVWSKDIDPAAGVLRLVFGLGTRAVERSDDDYTRVVALNAPDRRVEESFEQVRQFAQHKVDVLDLHANQLVSRRFTDLAGREGPLPVEMFATRDARRGGPATADRGAAARGSGWVLTFDRLLRDTTFVADMREMLRTLHRAYDFPVDVEFTANFFDEATYKINLLQCRPFQGTGGEAVADPPADIPAERLALEASGAVLGRSRVADIDRVIYVVPAAYGQLPVSDRYSVARLIGRLAHHSPSGAEPATMLLGPGRWGTTTPSLGVPANFGEINTVSVLGEIVAMRDDLVPDVSLGTHYFSDLVELDILYLAIFPGREGNCLNRAIFEAAPNRLADLAPEAARWASVVRVIDTSGPGGLTLNANAFKQRVVGYLRRGQP